MKITTRLFGEIDIEEDKIITFEDGIVGFPFLKRFTLIQDQESENNVIMWLQSMDEGVFAMPVMPPSIIIEDYAPTIHESSLEKLGNLTDDNTYSLVTVTVTDKIEEITANLKAPIIINMDTLKASQLIVEDDYQVKHPLYDLLIQKKEEK